MDETRSLDNDPQSKAEFKLDELRKRMPPHVFEKSLTKSLMFMVLDFLLWGSSYYGMWHFTHSSLWFDCPCFQKVLLSIFYWFVTGFFMWCIFVVGHDCGHGTFSKYELMNDVFGHLTHGSILVPYYSWQLSHRRHHMFHNHVNKDYSHPWYTPDKLGKPHKAVRNYMNDSTWVKLVAPFVGWQAYLLGHPDGSHFFPSDKGRLWKNTPAEEYTKCWVSTAVVVAQALLVHRFFQGHLGDIAFYYGMPWIMFGWWLVTVTYLQHHSPDTVVYGDQDWSFTEAAFETVDRKYGYGIDNLHHNITDGHVVHHLFYTSIPHYHLSAATETLKGYLVERGLLHRYKCEATFDFPLRIHKYMLHNWFRVKRAPL